MNRRAISKVRCFTDVIFPNIGFCFSDPHSGIAEYDICFGKTSRMCDLLPWFKYATRTRTIKHRYQLPEGLPVWVRIRAVNNGKIYLYVFCKSTNENNSSSSSISG